MPKYTDKNKAEIIRELTNLVGKHKNDTDVVGIRIDVVSFNLYLKTITIKKTDSLTGFKYSGYPLIVCNEKGVTLSELEIEDELSKLN